MGVANYTNDHTCHLGPKYLLNKRRDEDVMY